MIGTGGGRFHRRASTRRDVQVPIKINPPNVSSVIQNISPGGMKVKIEITPASFQISDEVRFLVWLNHLRYPLPKN